MKQFFKRVSKNPLVWFTDNFHAVEHGKCYRSKTLSARRLERRIKQYTIKTILNVREADSSAEWYKQEVALAQKYHVALYTISLNEKVFPTDQQIQKILSIFNNCTGPLLIHCKAGADRTGLVSALWVLEQQNGNLQQALAQQALWYGHIKWLYPKMRAFITCWCANQKGFLL